MSLCSCQRCAQLLRSCISNNNPLCKQPLGETTCPAVMDEAGRAPPKHSRTLFKLHGTARTPSSLLLLDPQPAPSQVCFSWVLSASFDCSHLPTQAFSVGLQKLPPASPLPPQTASSTLLAFLIPTCWEFSNSYLFSRLPLWAQMPTWHLCLDNVQVKAQRDPKMQCLNRGVAPSQIIARRQAGPAWQTFCHPPHECPSSGSKVVISTPPPHPHPSQQEGEEGEGSTGGFPLRAWPQKLCRSLPRARS